MITVRPAEERGRTRLDWLDSRHTFSFGEYFDPRNLRFGKLRVLNQDVVAPGRGFEWHPHRDMEILTIVLSGAVEHQDNMGNRFVLGPGEVQRMSAGTGIVHREWNPSDSEPLHLLQIWIEPERRGLAPGYEQKAVPGELLASRDAREGSVTLHQDAELRLLHLKSGERLRRTLEPGRGAWLQILRGRVSLGDVDLGPGDGASIRDEETVTVSAEEDTELLYFDLAGIQGKPAGERGGHS